MFQYLPSHPSIPAHQRHQHLQQLHQVTHHWLKSPKFTADYGGSHTHTHTEFSFISLPMMDSVIITQSVIDTAHLWWRELT